MRRQSPDDSPENCLRVERCPQVQAEPIGEQAITHGTGESKASPVQQSRVP